MTFTLLGAIVCGIAVVMLFVHERDYRAHRRWCATAAKAEGVVSRIGQRGWYSRNEPTGDEDNVSSVPVVRFKAANGVEYEFDAGDAPSHVGSVVQVAYDPALPSTARVESQRRKLGCVVFVLAGGLSLILWGVARPE